MKHKKLLLASFFLFCFLLAFPASASAYKNQWVTTPTGKYYYGSNGKVYTGGPKKIKSGGKYYYYIFDAKGKLITNQASYIKGKTYYSLGSGRLLTSFTTINGKKYYGTKSGTLKTGLVNYKNKYYYFQPKLGYALTSSTIRINQRTWYFNKYGQAVKNQFVTIGNAKYYFDGNYHRSYGLQQIGKYYYYFSKKTCKQSYGWIKDGNYRYYFDKTNKGRALTDGFKTIPGDTSKKKYYFNPYGQQLRGWLVLGSKRYYMDPSNNGARTYGKKKIDGKTYDFGTKGYITYHPSGKYTVRVNRKKCVVTIYDGTMPVKAMTCSVGAPGADTPTGTFAIQSHYRWWTLNGPSRGQYCSHFLPSYLFHSVPMYGPWFDAYHVAANDFNALGRPASGGCIRLCVADAKWIYDHVSIGSTVVISDHEATPLGKPTVPKMKSGTYGKDPTDKWT